MEKMFSNQLIAGAVDVLVMVMIVVMAFLGTVILGAT